MAQLSPQIFKSKSNNEVIIRSAAVEDSRAILSLSKSVINEEIYQLTSSTEFKMTIEAEEKWIESHLNNPNYMILVAVINSEIAGILDFTNGRRDRISHTGEFGMSVAKHFRDQGIGSLLLMSLIEWASKNKAIEKIGLSVHSNNHRAIALYKKMGFEIEGVRKRDLKYSNDSYVDTTIMGRFI